MIAAPDADRDNALLMRISRAGEAYVGPLPLRTDEIAMGFKKAFRARLNPPGLPPPPNEEKIAYIKRIPKYHT